MTLATAICMTQESWKLPFRGTGVSRLLQHLRGFPHRQSVERLQLLGFIPDEEAVRTEFYLPRRAGIDVLAGASDLIKPCTAIIAELSFLGSNEGAPLAADVISGIETLGFKCTDVCKLHRTGAGSVRQIDIVFARAALYERFRAAAGLR
jgi:hypothetical protein